MVNATELISPVTLNHDWPITIRLVVTVSLSAFGILTNGFFISSFFVEESLRRVGNVFMCCLGLSDMAVAGVVLPVSAVVMLSGHGDGASTCHFQQFINTSSCYAYSVFYIFVAADHFMRVNRNTALYAFTSLRVGVISFIILAVSFTFAAGGTFMGLDFDYCERLHFGNYSFRLSSFVMFFALPTFITILLLILSICRVHNRAKEPNYRRSIQYDIDLCMSSSNLVAYGLFIAHWLGFIVTIYSQGAEDVSDKSFYYLAWLGVSRCLYTSLLYGSMNKNFRRAFAHIYRYCCCRSSLSSSIAGRHRRALDYKACSGDVRVHIMHQAKSSPQRATTSRELQEL